MIRQQRRRIERQWNKIKVGAVCTEFIESNNLVSMHHIIDFKAVKLAEDLSLEKLLELIALMKKYPEQFSGFKEQIVEIMEKLKKTELFLKDALEES